MVSARRWAVEELPVISYISQGQGAMSGQPLHCLRFCLCFQRAMTMSNECSVFAASLWCVIFIYEIIPIGDRYSCIYIPSLLTEWFLNGIGRALHHRSYGYSQGCPDEDGRPGFMICCPGSAMRRGVKCWTGFGERMKLTTRRPDLTLPDP